MHPPGCRSLKGPLSPTTSVGSSGDLSPVRGPACSRRRRAGRARQRPRSAGWATYERTRVPRSRQPGEHSLARRPAGAAPVGQPAGYRSSPGRPACRVPEQPPPASLPGTGAAPARQPAGCRGVPVSAILTGTRASRYIMTRAHGRGIFWQDFRHEELPEYARLRETSAAGPVSGAHWCDQGGTWWVAA